MNRWINLACAGLFVGTTTCSLVFSASATVAKAASVHVPTAVTWSAVGFLELLSLAGTLRWLTATTSRGRLHAVVVVALAAAVTAQAGASFYGWWGVLAPVAVVLTIHMVAETLRDQQPVDDEVREPSPMTDPAPTGPLPRQPETTKPVELHAVEAPVEIDWTLPRRKLADVLTAAYGTKVTPYKAEQLKKQREAAS